VEASHTREIFCDEAFVLEREKTGETSLRLRLLSREHGLLNARAKGALAPQKPWGAHIDLYRRIEFTAAPMSTMPLVYLRDSRLLDPCQHIARSPEALHTAAYAAHLLLRALQPHYPCAPLFDLYSKLLNYMRNHEPSWLLVKRYELRVLAFLGHDPGDADTRLASLLAEHCHVSPLTRNRLAKQLTDLQRRLRHQVTFGPGTQSP
jgi:DNA repair protein RecO